MKPVSGMKIRMISALLLAAMALSSCGGAGNDQHESGSGSGSVGTGGTVTTGVSVSTDAPQWENPISFDGLDMFTHDDGKLFLDYKDDARKIYPFDDYSHVTEQKMPYFDTRSGVGIPDDDGAADSSVRITEDGGRYRTLWKFTARNGNAVPKLSIDAHNYHIFSKITFEVTNRSEKPISFGIMTSEFNAQPETNPKTGTFSAYSKPVKAGDSAKVTIDFSRVFADYGLLPLATGGITLTAVGAAKDTDYEILLSDFTFVWAENEALTDAAVGVKEDSAEADSGITVAVAAKGLTEEQDVAVEFHRGGSEFTWRVRLTDEEKAALIKNGIVGLETSVPWWADAGKYEAVLAVDSYRVKGAYSDTVSVTNGGKYTLPEAEVRVGGDGIPAIWINGKKFDWNGIASAAYGPGMAYEFGEQNSSVYIIETCAGAHNYPANCYPTLVAPGVNDFSQLEEYCNFTMQADRDAYILLRVNFCLLDFWAEENPDDVALGTADGKTFVTSEESSGMNNISFASRKWVEEEKRQIKALMDYVKSQPWCSRVIGCMLTGGVTEEWFAFFHNTEGMWGDFSKVNTDAFLEWGKNRSITDGLPDLHIPLPSERVNKNFTVKPESDASRLAAAYTQYINELCISVIGEFADAFKSESENRMLCGALYGYLIEFSTANSPTEAGSLTLKQYLAEESIDFMCGIPLLDWRDPTNGYDIGIGLTRSIQAAGKMYIQENDTWLSTYTKRVYPSSRPGDSMDGNLDMLESTFAYDMVYGNGRHYFSLFASWHHDSRLKELFTEFNAAQEKYLDADRTPAEQIAFLIDDTSYTFSEESSQYLNTAVKETLKSLGRTGGAVGLYLLSDIDRLPDTVKLVVVSVAWAPDTETLGKLKTAVEKGGRTIVLVGPVGLINPETGKYNTASTKKLTGFDVSVEFGAKLTSLRLTDIGGTKISSSAYVDVNPVCRLNGSSNLSAVKDLANGGRLIWMSVPLTVSRVWRDIGKDAGVTFTANINSYVHASKELVSVTASANGTQKLYFGRPVTVVDVLSGWEGSGDEYVECVFYAGQTRLFYVKDK